MRESSISKRISRIASRISDELLKPIPKFGIARGTLVKYNPNSHIFFAPLDATDEEIEDELRKSVFNESKKSKVFDFKRIKESFDNVLNEVRIAKNL